MELGAVEALEWPSMKAKMGGHSRDSSTQSWPPVVHAGREQHASEQHAGAADKIETCAIQESG